MARSKLDMQQILQYTFDPETLSLRLSQKPPNKNEQVILVLILVFQILTFLTSLYTAICN